MNTNKLFFHEQVRVVFILTLCFCVFHAKAQNFADKSFYLVDSLKLNELTDEDKHLLDSALTIYHEVKTDTDRFNAITIITENMVHKNWYKYNQFLYTDLQQMLGRSSLPEKKEIFIKKELANVLGNMGFYANYYESNIPKALGFFHKALKLSREINDKANVATMLNNIGSSSESIGDISAALEYYHESLLICEESGNKKGMPSALNNIGLIHMNQGNYTEALDYFEKSLKIHEELGEKQNVAVNLEHIGDIYRLLDEPAKAMEYLLKSLEVAKEIGDKTIIARELKSIAEEYILMGDIDNATISGEKAYALYKEMQNKKGMAMASNLLGEIAMKQNRMDKAKKYAAMSLQMAQELGFPGDIQNAALLWSNIYRKEGNYKMGWDKYKLYIVMRDSMINENILKSTIRQETKYEFEKNQLIKEHNEQEQARLQKENANRRANFQYAIILIFLLVLFIGIALMGRVRVTPKLTQVIIYLAILILFESSLVVADPYVETIAKGEPAWKLLMNVSIALLLFPLNAFLEKRLKTRVINGKKK